GVRWRSQDWWIDLHELRRWRHVGCGQFVDEALDFRVASEEPLHLSTQRILQVGKWPVAQNVGKAEVPEHCADVLELVLHSAMRSSCCSLHLAVEIGLDVRLVGELGSEHGEVCGDCRPDLRVGPTRRLADMAVLDGEDQLTKPGGYGRRTPPGGAPA